MTVQIIGVNRAEPHADDPGGDDGARAEAYATNLVYLAYFGTYEGRGRAWYTRRGASTRTGQGSARFARLPQVPESLSCLSRQCSSPAARPWSTSLRGPRQALTAFSVKNHGDSDK
jgi:hypothetical protein